MHGKSEWIDAESIRRNMKEYMSRYGLGSDAVGDLSELYIDVYGSVGSTNTLARELAEARPELRRAVLIAEHQSAGRGRHGRSFESEARVGLYISVLFRGEGIGTADGATVRTAVDLSEAVKNVTGAEVGIKWVNDMIASGRKLAGILAEGAFDAEKGELLYSVIGIGINLYKRSFGEELADIAVSLEDITEKKADPNLLAAALICEMLRDKNRAEVIEKYRERSVTVGTRVKIKPIGGGEEYFAFAEKIEDNGSLTVIPEGYDAEGMPHEPRTLISAEVSASLS